MRTRLETFRFVLLLLFLVVLLDRVSSVNASNNSKHNNPISLFRRESNTVSSSSHMKKKNPPRIRRKWIFISERIFGSKEQKEQVSTSTALLQNEIDGSFSDSTIINADTSVIYDNVDTIMGGTILGLGMVSLGQALQTMLGSSKGVIHHTVSRSVGPPTQLAWKEIGQLVQRLQAEPNLRAWMQYPPQVVWQSLQAIRKLQQALPKEEESFAMSNGKIVTNLEDSECKAIGKELAYFSVYASLAYGWPMALARGLGKWRGGGNLHTLLQQTGLDETNVIEAVWQAETHRPAYLLVEDPYQKAIVLSIRGTWSAPDLLTDLCCSTSVLPQSSNDTATALWQWLRPHKYPALEAHNGMMQAAVSLKDCLQHRVADALRKNPDHRLVLVGHSMGGGAAALLGLMWQNDFDNPVVYVYGPPCVAPFESQLTNHGRIHSVVLPGDPFCTLSLGHMIELAATVDYFGKHAALRRRICHRPVSSRYASEIWSLLDEQVWSKIRVQSKEQSSSPLLSSSSSSSAVTKKLVPPGRLWLLVPQKKKKRRWRLERAHTKQFLALSLQPFALDLTQHVPVLYESCLQAMLCDK